MKLVVGLAGASGSIYAARFLRALYELEGETYITASPAALRIFSEEYETKVESVEEILSFVESKWKPQTKHKFHVRNFFDIGSDIASGSNTWDGMVVIPCSMKTVASMSQGLTENLIERAADVSLKERRRLIVVPRETPYNRIHLKNLLNLDEAGAIILPASPGFYQMPKTLDDLGDFIAGRILGLLGVNQTLFPKWLG
ncbi:UbiX family flavin prenyltransferase [Leptospira bandrabouensis]|uniref:Flavin prenyltransferase UbiX n=1 Tax=Leptospira bandrabouensis TaxID=2484903 RepID=A0A6H3NLQ9_9LEPT|nr:UbiX family flavin prenyltransferase [Leptospira bandrabouensis]MCG6143008.1 UbiX family flavin prenyltransferase [Leptospira bandrabouensis]MCG6151960.1 UbiX family flavin prenyltransferase [Leptospira bandrabouensis]MCG6158667.1 UbiX family flavin prenyltransferase [Leptospira bandrabouensis]MCG6162603.1 UbiX family flavin prenyltransferase [Leptospira bandrabouensis]MCW7459913.1 UbiX family flavin prenyltransferase [Leptospira bandrabouensis]